MAERNEDYYALKARIDKWGVWLILVYPLFAGIILVFGGSWLGQRLFPEVGGMLGFFVGGAIWQASSLYLWKQKFGFIMHSKEQCQNCGMSMARWNGNWMTQDHVCRECGNNNSIDLKPLNSKTKL